MSRLRNLILSLALAVACDPLTAQTSGPNQRKLTEPGSIVSLSNPQARPIPIGDLFFTRSVTGASWSPDGKEVAFTTDLSGRLNLWKVNSAGGWPIQLVQSDDRQYAATWSPDGQWVLFQQDKGGNELWDVLAVPSNGGLAMNLTNTPEVREESPRWSRDGSQVALNYKPKQASAYDIAVLDWKTRKVRQVTRESTPDHSWASVAWSPDGKILFANRTEISFTDSDVYSIDVATGQVTNLTPHQGKVLYVASSLSPDGKTLLVTSNQAHGYQNVALMDVGTKKLIWVTHTEWEAGAGDFSPDGKNFSYTINADGRTDGYVEDLATMHARKIQVSPGINAFPAYPNSFSPTGDRLLLSHESSVQPADFFIYDVNTHRSKQLTYSSIASLSSTPMPQSQIVHYKSFDGKTISALMWVPFNMRRDRSNPALVLPHGGPTGQTQDFWSPRVAALVSQGYLCIAPNVRGSTGYGIDFQRSNYQDLGGGDLQDEVYAAKFLDGTGYVGAKRIGITGGSYGGFMTLMALGKTPEIWATGVDLYGIIDWKTMFHTTEPQLREYLKSLLGDPIKDVRIYESASPITYIHQIKAPLLVLQGENDVRVPKEETDQVIELLKKDGQNVDVHYYPNEGHGFEKRENQIDSIRRTLDWLNATLRK